jgi:hypothetical protein
MATFINRIKSGLLIYFSASNETIYLTGADETDYLITQNSVTWANLTKN